MKRLFVLLFLLPSLGSCTIEEGYYRDYREPPARVRVEAPNYHTHRHYHEAPRHEHPYAAPNTKEHGHVSRSHERMYERNTGAVVRIHGHD